MQSRWILAALASVSLGFSACATSTTFEDGSGGSTGTGTSSSTGTGASGGAGGNGGGGGIQPCVGADDCVLFSDLCNLGTCINGTCGAFPTNEDLPCDDGAACTLTEACKAGVCTAITQKFCPASDSCHVGTCDVATDSCTEAPGNDGAGCIDDDPCTLTGVCNGGACAPGQPVDCSFLDGPCSVGMCDPQLGCIVSPQNDGFPCDDGLFCTDVDQCLAGACGGQPKACAPPGNPCLIGSCDEFTNTCLAVPGNNGAACDDGDLCTGGETCSAGTCVGGGPANPGAACDDNNACTSGTTCQNGACAMPTSEISQCIDNDACCPTGCQDIDDDCTTSVLLVYTDDFGNAVDVQSTLFNTGAFTAVDLYDATNQTPTLAELTPYKAVLLYSNFGFSDPFTIGNNLADYFDGGGRVVLTTAANCNNYAIGGRFISDGYHVIGLADVDFVFSPDSLGTVSEPASPLMNGVVSLSSETTVRCLGQPANGGVVVAAWGNGVPLIVRGTIQGRNRVDLNLFPISGNVIPQYWSGNGGEIMKNALLFD